MCRKIPTDSIKQQYSVGQPNNHPVRSFVCLCLPLSTDNERLPTRDSVLLSLEGKKAASFVTYLRIGDEVPGDEVFTCVVLL